MSGHRQDKAETDHARRETTVHQQSSPSTTSGSVHGAPGVLQLQRTVGNQAVCRLASGGVVQAKLHVGPAGDNYEREADQVAAEVMRNLHASVAPAGGEQRLRVRRSTGEEIVGAEGGPLGADTEAGIRRHRGSGAPLPDPLRRSMEGSFGADFGGVRVHTGHSADELNRSLQSRAFTVGGDIFFARNQYQPHAQAGQMLLAHELTHTVQQGAVHRTVQRKPPKTLKSGKDPLKDLATSSGLVYGMSTTRKETSKRLNLQDNLQGTTRYRTIDAYNLETGINAVMDGDAAVGIFVVREALEEGNPIAAWSNHFPAANANLQNDADLEAWINELVNRKAHIGLYDLGLAGGNAQTSDPVFRMQRKNRFGKNFTGVQQATNTGLTPQSADGSRQGRRRPRR